HSPSCTTLFRSDPELPILAEKEIKPGEQAFLYDIGAVSDPETPQVLAAASRVYQEKRTAGSYSFLTKSPEGTGNVMRILLPSKPRHVQVSGPDKETKRRVSQEWDAGTHTLKLEFLNSSEGVRVQLQYGAAAGFHQKGNPSAGIPARRAAVS